MLKSRIDEIRKELTTWNRRLQLRKEQRAKFGISADPSVEIEIEDIENIVRRLQYELQELEYKQKQSQLFSRIVDIPENWLSENISLFVVRESPYSIRTQLYIPKKEIFSGLMPFDTDEIGDPLADFPKLAFRYSDVNIDKQLGQKLFNLTISQPVKQALETLGSSSIELIIEPDLQYLPWELLHNGHEFLCLKHAFGRRLVPLTNEKNPQKTINTRQKLSQILLGVRKRPLNFLIICSSGSRDILQGAVQREARLIADVCARYPNVELTFPACATKYEVLDLLYRGQDIVHCIGHASYQVGLLLSGGALDVDMIASASALNQSRSLFFLNVCETARIGSSEGKSAGYIFASNNFMVVAPLTWVLEDLALRIAPKFYEYLLSGKSIGESLRLAKLHVYVCGIEGWWSYILYGDPSACLT